MSVITLLAQYTSQPLCDMTINTPIVMTPLPYTACIYSSVGESGGKAQDLTYRQCVRAVIANMLPAEYLYL